MSWRSLAAVVRMGLRVLVSRIIRRPMLVNLILSVTDRCNLRCSYCGIPGRALPEMSLAGIKRILDQFAAMGGTRVALWGGEPLMRDDIGEIVRHCRRLGFLTSMDTNGLLLPEKISEVADLDVCVVSLDGDEFSHDASRGKGSYAKVLAGIDAALARGLPVWTITVLNRNNLGSVEHILDLAERKGFVTTWQVLHHQELASPSASDCFPPMEEYRAVLERLLSFKRRGRPIANSSGYFRYLLRWPDLRTSVMKEPRGGADCSAAGLYANVDTDGRVYPCSVLVGRQPALNALESGLPEAAAFALRQGLPCRSCTAGCYIEYNRLYSFHPVSVLNWFGYVVMRGRGSGRPKLVGRSPKSVSSFRSEP